MEGWIASLESLGLGDAPAFAVLALQAGDPAQRRAASLLARALAPTCGLVVVSSEPAPAAEPPWRAAVLEPLELEALEPWVERWMEAEPEAHRRQFARALHTACGGSASALDQIAERAVQRKWVLRGGRLRPGPVPTASELGLRGDPTQEGLSPGELALARVLALSGGRAAMGLCLAALGPDLVQSKASLAALASRGRLRLHGGREPTLEWCGALEAQRFPLEDRRATAARVALHLARVEGEALKSGSGAESGLAASGRVLARQAWGAVADPIRAEEFARALGEARERGSPEAAISSAEFVRNALGQACDSRLTGELALAYGQIGLLDRALELSAELAQDDQARGPLAPPRDAATAERVRGRVALLRHEPALALEHFERAAGLDRDDGGEALLARVQLAAQLGRDAEVLELVGTASATPAEVQPRLLRAIEVYGAMSLVRTGEIGRAREILSTQLAQAIELHDDLRVAALSMNLGTLERRAGELHRSLAHFERADACATRARSATQSAQIRGASAALTRDLGELARAEEFSLSALSMRLRLGDHAGAQVARGILALVLAERGHVGRAAAEAELAAAELGKSGRLQDAELLSCTAVECRARLGVAPEEVPEGVRDPAGAGDPRALLTLARAQAYSGHLVPAREPARRAADLAGRLGLEPVRVQAQCWLELLAAPRAIPQVAGAEDQPLLRLDLELQRLLASEPLDVPAAGRLALELERRGRDDRLARLWIAVAARASGIETQRSAWAKAEAALARCALGARQGTELALRSNLLSVPEPWPEDHVLARAAAQQDGEHEMDVLRLLEINHRLVEQPNLTALLGEIVDCALSVSGAERGFLVLEKDGELEFDTALDSRRGDIPLPEMEISRSILSEALGAMRPLRLSNAAEDPALGAAASVIALELRSVLCAPFRIDKQARGVIYVDHRLKSGAFTDRAERMLSLLADQASLAITQVRRMDEIRRLNRRLNQRMVEAESELKSNQRALARAGLPLAAGGLVGSSPAIREVQRQIDLASQARLAVLLQGPSGSGKELAARAVHARSPRSEDPFVCENCAALPPALIEAEFFGSVRGAFTGAERDRAGLFERADHGTLFLDEIGELPLELQAKLLRVLESGEVRRLGSTDVRKVDVRLVSATNRDLAREVREGRFRADLYYRIEGMRIVLPSLEARGEDIPELVDHFLRLSAEPGAAPRRVSPAVLSRLAARPWPGNVRELRNEVARLCLLSPGDLLDPDRVSEPELALSPHAPDQLLTLADLERDAILRALRATGGDKNEAARRLGISRAKIYQRLKEWGVG
ncbi:MAG: sigma 54-interacting transcriptional regulator [Planctomycetes bacterium]|nr:sigma 54-interacting transcriptional regulator [Planctomycetota bacterium]